MLTNDFARAPQLGVVSVPLSGAPVSSVLLPSVSTTRFADAKLLPNDGAIIAYGTYRLPRPRVRVIIRENGVNSRPMTISDKARGARLAQVFASPSGAAAVLYQQRIGSGSKRVMRLAFRGVGQARFAQSITLDSANDVFGQVFYNAAGEGVVVMQANGSGAKPAVAIRRVSSTGAVGPVITLDGVKADIATATAAVGADGTIGVLWSRVYKNRSKTDLRWAKLAPESTTATTVTLGPSGDTSAEVENLAVATAGGRWIAAAGLGVPGENALTKLRIFEATDAGPMALTHTFGPGVGITGAQAVAHANGQLDVLWLQRTSIEAGASTKLMRAVSTTAGAWPEAGTELFSHVGEMTLRAVAPDAPAGVFAAAELQSPDFSSTSAVLIRSDR